MWTGGNMQLLYSLLHYIYVVLLLSSAVYSDVRLILMAVVDVREEVSVQLFSSNVPRYRYV